MKVEANNKSIKAEINENLSIVVKNLQQESSNKTNGQQCIQSESTNAQHFIAVLESAVIHGLKASYYEKKKHAKELPKPQFWNLVCKISHKDTINQAKHLKMIKSHIGLCRAWLRLALNDSALSSYLTSLLSTAEHKSILSHYYENFALFRDAEQADIFLQYLQGAENLEFQLACNSSVLNLWVRTPLEIAGVIPPSLNRKAFLDNNNSEQSPSPSNMPRVTSLPNHMVLTDSLVSSSSGSSLKESLHSPLSISPALSINSDKGNVATSLPPIPTLPTSIGQADGNQSEELVKVDPHIGTAPSRSLLEVDGPRERGSILHSRHLKKRRRGMRRNQSSDFGSWGSLSSMGSNFSTNSSPQKKHNKGKNSRSSSISSNAPSSLNSSDMSTQEQCEEHEKTNENVLTQHNLSSSAPLSSIPGWRRHSTPTLSEKQKQFSRHRRHKPSSKVFMPGQGEYVGKDTEAKVEEVNEEEEITQDVDADSTSSTLNPSQSEQSVHDLLPTDPAKGPSPTQFVLDVGDRVSFELPPAQTLGTYQPEYSPIDEGPDIYARAASPSVSAVEEQDETSDPYFHAPCTPISPGNSLLCGVGWSSEHPYHNQQENNVSTPVTNPPISIADNSHTAVDGKLKLAIHREGYLQKKGETLLFWRTRWFVLNSETLTYYKDKNMEERLGRILMNQVVAVKDDDIKKNKSISLLMQDGMQHLIAAESQKLIRGWAKDLKKVSEIAANEGNEYKPPRHNTIGSDFEVLETSNVPDHYLGDDVSGSWHGSMMHNMTRIANEQGLDSQNYQCADCASPIGIIYGTPRLCSFTGQYYCPQCHLNEEHVIPARMLQNWDFRKHKVAKRSKRFLAQIWRDPCIEMDKANPAAYRHIAPMKLLLPLRLKLSSLQPYLLTCRKLSHTQRNSKLQGYSYMLENPHIYSSLDLQKAQSGDLCDVIEKIVTFGIDHVRNCPLCSAKGFLCEICRKDDVIFAFDTDATTQCDDCKSVYHKECLIDPAGCPKCERRNARFQKQEQDLIDDVTDEDT